jgi:hypothetical protein
MLRMIFLLLLLGNLAYFAWDRYLRAPVSAETHIQQVQITPEKIRILPPKATGAPAPAAKPAAPVAEAKPTPTPLAAAACVEWGVFIGPPDAARADAAMLEAGLPAAQTKRVLTDVDGHWVLIPPLKSAAEAAAAIEKLKALGISEYSIVPEPPQWRNAVSLGIFRTEEAARSLLADMQKKGVPNVILERRPRFFQQMVYFVREPGEADLAKLTALRTRVPGSDVKAVACPAP